MKLPKNFGKMRGEMKLTKIDKQIAIVNQYTICGVPASSLKRLCREAKICYPKLMKELRNQTMGVVGGEGLIYRCDIVRFIKGLPVID